MSESTKETIHKEFELERMILFSDAVFAIAITLLIIEIKFPELPEDFHEHPDLWKLLKPTLIEFMAFALSFFFIGVSWVRHLKMFRYLRAYDNRVIFFNLTSLFFIVTFPFSASALLHIRPSFMFPVLFYFGNVMLIFVTNFLLANYIFKLRPALSMPGFEAEKKFIYITNLAFAVCMAGGFLIMLVIALVSGFHAKSMEISLYSVSLLLLVARRWTRRYKPKKESLSV